MKRVYTLILAASMFLPLIAAPVSCSQQEVGPTILKLFANPECLDKYGFTIPD